MKFSERSRTALPGQTGRIELVILGLAAVAVLALYLRSLRTLPAGDDWLLIQPVRDLVRHHGLAGGLLACFGTAVWDFYRPLALVVMVLGGGSFAGLQMAKLVVMLGLVWLVYRTGIRAGVPSRLMALVAAATALHQTFAAVLSEIDLWADLAAAVCYVVLLELCVCYAQRMRTWRFLISSSLVTAVCLLWKEAGVACFSIPLLFALLRPLEPDSRKRRGYLLAAAAMLALTGAYLGTRFLLGISSSGSPEGYYSLHVGGNVPLNVALVVIGLLSPVNTVHVALDHGVWKFLTVCWTLGIGVLVLNGLRLAIRRGSWRLPVILAIAAVCAQGPVMLMPHTTESNISRSVALGMIAVALCVHECLLHDRRYRWPLAAVLLLWLGFSATAVYAKSIDIVEGQFRAARFRSNMATLMPVPDRQRVVVAVIDPGIIGYSVYRWPLFQDLRGGDIPYALQDQYTPSDSRYELVMVKDHAEATALNAHFYAHDDGQVEDCRAVISGEPAAQLPDVHTRNARALHGVTWR